MTRVEFLVVAAAATNTRAAAHPDVRAEVTIRRDDDALLSPFTVAITLHNGSGHLLTLDFPTTDLYRIDVIRAGGAVAWSSATGHHPLPIVRRLNVSVGTLRLVNHVIDGITDEQRAYAPGPYTVRVTFLGTTLAGTIDKPIAFADPLPIADALRARPGKIVTIAGRQRDTDIPQLEDASGTMRLSHALALHPSGTYVLRGYVQMQGDERVFVINRFAPAFDNSSPTVVGANTLGSSSVAEANPVTGLDR
jgi:hypothetical protein